MDWIFSKPFRVYILLGLLWLLFSIATFSLARGESIHPPIPPPVPQSPVIYFYGEGTPPAIQKVPGYAFLQCRPLVKGDLIIDVRRYATTGDSLYEKIPKYARENYLKTGWDPAKTKMLVIVTNRNRSFSLSGNVSSSWSNTDTDNQMSQILSKSTSSSLYSSGSISPSFSQSWVSQRFSIIFMLIE